jgi:hypothetical protein
MCDTDSIGIQKKNTYLLPLSTYMSNSLAKSNTIVSSLMNTKQLAKSYLVLGNCVRILLVGKVLGFSQLQDLEKAAKMLDIKQKNIIYVTTNNGKRFVRHSGKFVS